MKTAINLFICIIIIINSILKAHSQDDDGLAQSQIWDCAYQPMTGNCRGHIKRYYFNLNTEKCLPFVWGGCETNPNNFGSHDECSSRCYPKKRFRSRGGRVKNYESHWQKYRYG